MAPLISIKKYLYFYSCLYVSKAKMASSVVSDVRSRLKNGNLDYESLVIFTEEPPLGEDHFTVVKRSDILNIPVGVKADARLSNQFRLTGHVLNFFAGKGLPRPRRTRSSSPGSRKVREE